MGTAIFCAFRKQDSPVDKKTKDVMEVLRSLDETKKRIIKRRDYMFEMEQGCRKSAKECLLINRKELVKLHLKHALRHRKEYLKMLDYEDNLQATAMQIRSGHFVFLTVKSMVKGSKVVKSLSETLKSFDVAEIKENLENLKEAVRETETELFAHDVDDTELEKELESMINIEKKRKEYSEPEYSESMSDEETAALLLISEI